VKIEAILLQKKFVLSN